MNVQRPVLPPKNPVGDSEDVTVHDDANLAAVGLQG